MVVVAIFCLKFSNLFDFFEDWGGDVVVGELYVYDYNCNALA